MRRFCGSGPLLSLLHVTRCEDLQKKKVMKVHLLVISNLIKLLSISNQEITNALIKIKEGTL